MLDCSRYIGIFRKLYLTSSVTQTEYLFTFEKIFYAELQHFYGRELLPLNGEIFVCLSSTETVLSRLLKRGFSHWIRSTHMELLLIRSRKFLFQFLLTTTHFVLSFNLLTSHIFDNICTISLPFVCYLFVKYFSNFCRGVVIQDTLNHNYKYILGGLRSLCSPAM